MERNLRRSHIIEMFNLIQYSTNVYQQKNDHQFMLLKKFKHMVYLYQTFVVVITVKFVNYCAWKHVRSQKKKWFYTCKKSWHISMVPYHKYYTTMTLHDRYNTIHKAICHIVYNWNIMLKQFASILLVCMQCRCVKKCFHTTIFFW